MTTLGLFSAVASGSLLSAVWQGILLAGCVALCLRLVPGISAAARSVIWTAVLVLAVCLHFVPLFAAPDSTTHASVHADPRWSFVVAGFWALLTLYRGSQLLLSGLRLHRIARRATPVADAPALQQGNRRAQLCTSTDVDRPSVVGFFSPRVLLPPDLLASLSQQELDQILLHEMEHLRRRDDWTNLLQKLALALFPLNPVLLWVERRLCLERELACDDSVLRTTRARKAYALCLTNLAEHGMLRRTATLALGAWERQSELARRVHRILANPEVVMGRTQARIVTATLLLSLAGGATVLSRSPELVSFAPVSHAQAAIPSTEFTAAPYRESGLTGKVINTKAIMPEPERTTQLPVIAPKHRRSKSKTVNATQPIQIRSAVRPGTRSWVVLTEWHEVTLPTGHTLMTIQQNNQFSYAAVPTPTGWLIVQL
ncbi:M56 family metallopeptidase [Granulicella sibirica]|uniref:Regulatory sensor-transducer, BlaR1/MecR1 family n=1 Tax=Granulicella sibirica TaxID=2479048 RepID=A0A4Q0SXQ7_9BACT|nr:M56 family metallopeptidase [Granulicella sibirica]RXH55172.1 Regulatory sensor-transducer, BlaR1/MecR1 family [Granulicella sibirica]